MLTRTFFARSPFTAGRFAPLPAGAISARGTLRDRLLTLRAGLLSKNMSALREQRTLTDTLPDTLEAALLVSAQLGDEELRHDALQLCDAVIDTQHEDGSFGECVSFATRGRMLRAISCAYALTAERRQLTFMLRYMKYLSDTLKEEPLGESDAMHIADTLEAGMLLYNITGQRAILPVLTLLISQGADYTSLFSAFPYRTPISRAYPDLKRNSGDAYAEHLLRTADGANLCEGLRASALSGMITGSGKHLSAPEIGLTRLNRAHGAVCGGITADPLLAGTHPSRGVSAASIAELAASLETMLCCPGGDFCADQLETLMYNAVSAAFTPDCHAVQAVQQANQVAIDGAARFPLMDKGASLFACRDAQSSLLSAWPRFVQHQWMLTRDDGLCAMGYAPCAVRYRLGGVGVRVLVESDYPVSGSVRITLNVERETAFPLVLRIPDWAHGATAAIGGEILPAEAGSFLTLNREWQDGDAILLTLPMTVERIPSFHQAISIARGPLRFAYAPKSQREISPEGFILAHAQDGFGVALVLGAEIDVKTDDGRVTLCTQAVPVPAWTMHGPSADQPPIMTGSHRTPMSIELVPYADAMIRLSVLPTV